ncbi:MAG: hypothetical protein V3R16_02440 [Nitrospirales bacterium]
MSVMVKRRLFLGVIILCLLAATTIVSRPPAHGVRDTLIVAELQPATLRKDRCYVVTDAASDADCSTGAGSILNICCSNGTTYFAVGDGAGAGSYDLDIDGDVGGAQIITNAETLQMDGGTAITTTMSLNQVSIGVTPNSLDFTEFLDTMAIDPGAADPGIQTILIGDNERFLFAATDTGSTGATDNPFAITLQWDENVDAADTRLGVSILSTNDNTFADSGTTTVMEIRTVPTANNGQYTHMLDLVHGEDLADTMDNGLRIGGNTANSIIRGINVSNANLAIAIDIGQNPITSSGILTIGTILSGPLFHPDTTRIDLVTDGGTVSIDGGYDAADITLGIVPQLRVGDDHILQLPEIDAAIKTNDGSGANDRLAIFTEVLPVANRCLEINATGQLITAAGACGTGTTTTTVNDLLPSTDWVIPLSAGALEVVFGSTFPRTTLDFDDTTDESVYIEYHLPTGYRTADAFTVTINWSANSTDVANQACWCISAADFAASAGADPAVEETVCEDDAPTGTVNQRIETIIPLTQASYAGTNGLVLRLFRDSDSGDAGCEGADITGDTRFHSAMLTYGLDL